MVAAATVVAATVEKAGLHLLELVQSWFHGSCPTATTVNTSSHAMASKQQHTPRPQHRVNHRAIIEPEPHAVLWRTGTLHDGASVPISL